MAAIILAAGASTRMGLPKQLLRVGGKTLLEDSVDQALDAGFNPLLVVVGAQARAVRALVSAKRVEVVENARWADGMGTSIGAGIEYLEGLGPDLAAVAILVGDQPMVKAEHLRAMCASLEASRDPAVAAFYSGCLGVPAVFRKALFPLLKTLPPDAGARRLLRSGEFRITSFELPEAAVDIDTPEDYRQLTGK